MFDLGMSELLVIGVVALIVIGPKDLPNLFRSLGRFTAKMRAMAREFSRAMEAAADDTGVKDVAKDLKAATSAQSMGLNALKEATDRFEKWDPLKNAARPTAPTPAPSPAPVAAAPADPVVASPAPAMGPATQALAEEREARKAVALEAAAKLAKPQAAKAPAQPAAEATPPAPAAKKPRAPRKPKPDSPKADA